MNETTLEKKLREVEDEHFGEIEQTRLGELDQDFIIAAHRFHGALEAVTSIARSLTSKTIEGLMEVEDKKYYLAWTDPVTGENFKRFVDYLNSDEVPDLSKNKYYDLKALLLSEGAEAFDVFSGKKIPVSTRKLLAAKGVEISVDGDDLVIADKRVPVTDRAAMKELVETVHSVLRERDAREEKQAHTIEKLENTVRAGQEDFEQLQRSLDAMREGDPYDQAISAAVYALLELTETIGQLSDKRKAEVGPTCMRTMWDILQQVRRATGVSFSFDDGQERAAAAVAGGKPSLTQMVLAEDDDFGDEDEV